MSGLFYSCLVRQNFHFLSRDLTNLSLKDTTRVNRKFKSKMFGALRGSAWRTQSVVKNSVSRQITRNFGDDVQVGRPINAWGPQAMWVCTVPLEFPQRMNLTFS